MAVVQSTNIRKAAQHDTQTLVQALLPLGVVSTVTGNTVTVIRSGQNVPDRTAYKCLNGQAALLAPGDDVLLAQFGASWVVIGGFGKSPGLVDGGVTSITGNQTVLTKLQRVSVVVASIYDPISANAAGVTGSVVSSVPGEIRLIVQKDAAGSYAVSSTPTNVAWMAFGQ